MPKKKTVKKAAPKRAAPKTEAPSKSKADALRARAWTLRSSFTGGQRTPEQEKLDVVAMALEEVANFL